MLIYGSEVWSVRKRVESRFRAAETKFMRKAEAGRTPLDYRKNLDTVKEGTEYTTYTGIHRKLQKEQLHRMSRSRIAFQILTYQPQRRRIWEDY
jgi:hypothetical protein